MNRQTNAANPLVARYFLTIGGALGLAFGLVTEPVMPGVTGALRHFLQWQLQTILPICLLMMLQIFISKIPYSRRGGPWPSLIITGLLASLLFAPLGLLIDTEFLGDPYTLEQLIDEFVGLAPPVMLCWTAMNAPIVADLRSENTPRESIPERPDKICASSTTTIKPTVNPAFFRLLSENKRGELIYLKAELHYLSVVTTNGCSLILYNLRDAIQELPTNIGVQTHRSYWVAFDQVKSLHKTGREGEIKLLNGLRIPVSRARLKGVTAQLGQYADLMTSNAITPY